MDTLAPAASSWVKALASRNFEALRAALDPAVKFRALVPGETVTAANAAETTACFERWFGNKTDIEILDERVAVLVDRQHVWFRARVCRNNAPYLIEQSLWGDVEEGRFVAIDLLCSGFRPEGAGAGAGATHVFDAGELGCGTGLPREFRTRLAQIPVGHVLEVVTSDLAAKEDLPSLARLLGHRVLSVEPGADRKLRIRVERSK